MFTQRWHWECAEFREKNKHNLYHPLWNVQVPGFHAGIFKIVILYVVTTCDHAFGCHSDLQHWHLRCRLWHYPQPVNIKAAYFSEKSAAIYQTTRYLLSEKQSSNLPTNFQKSIVICWTLRKPLIFNSVFVPIWSHVHYTTEAHKTRFHFHLHFSCCMCKDIK